LPNGLKNDSDSLGDSGGSAPQEDRDLELKKQELELCQTDPNSDAAEVATLLRVSSGDCGVILPLGEII
jgi:hypothetical protein